VTRTTARTVANVVFASAGVAAAYVIVTTPPLRRLALGAVTYWLGAHPIAYLAGELRQAWAASARFPAQPA
jgi:hypothetical protein